MVAAEWPAMAYASNAVAALWATMVQLPRRVDRPCVLTAEASPRFLPLWLSHDPVQGFKKPKIELRQIVAEAVGQPSRRLSTDDGLKGDNDETQETRDSDRVG